METPIDELKRLIEANADECEWLFFHGGSCSERDVLDARNELHKRAKRMVALVAELDQIAADAVARFDTVTNESWPATELRINGCIGDRVAS
jgi:hypothetical protein